MRLIASLAVVVAGMDKAAIVADIRLATVVGVDTDNIVEAAAFAVEQASLIAIHNYHKTLTQKQQGRRI
jgi:hypothetical protein